MNSLSVVSNEESSVDLASQDFDSNQFNKLVEKLKTLLQDDDTAAAAADVIDELYQLPGIGIYQRDLKALAKFIEAYDFEQGLEILDKLSIS